MKETCIVDYNNFIKENTRMQTGICQALDRQVWYEVHEALDNEVISSSKKTVANSKRRHSETKLERSCKECRSWKHSEGNYPIN